MEFPSGKIAIVGVYVTEQGKLPHRSRKSLMVEALKGALDDAGLDVKDLDGVRGSEPHPTGDDGWISQQIGKTLVNVGSGGQQGADAITEVSAFINAGLCETVAIVHAHAGPRVGMGGSMARVDEWSTLPHGMLMVTWYAQMAQRHMHEFGTTSEQLAEVSKTFRKHATLNPMSVMGKKGELTTEDVLNSRMICSPLHLLDCCLDNEGGFAIIMTTEERAKDLKKKPVYVLGGATGVWSAAYEEINENYYPSPAAVTGPKALGTAGISHDDLDVLGIYDCFTITVVRLLEDLGFCKLGEGGPLVASGALGLEGKWPANTNGGALSNSHNKFPGGLHVIEVVQQLRGGEVEPERQVPNAKLGLIHTQGYAVLGRNATCVLGTK